MTDKPTIFISYSHKDERPWKELVEGHLRVAERQSEFLVWSDRRMAGGDAWRKVIDRELEAADIAVLLISHNFLTSAFIMDHEVNVLLERKQQEGLRLYPILIRSCNWSSVDWLENLTIRPLDGKALASFRGDGRDSATAGMAAEIGRLLKEDKKSDEEIDELRAEAETLGEKLGVTEEAVQSFLTILDQKHVAPTELQEKLREIAHQYQEMQVRLEALDQDDPVIKTWIGEAKTAIDDGNYDEADTLLVQAEQRDLSAARQAAAQADQRYLNAAATRALRGETSLTQLRYLDAAEHFAEAAKLVPDNEAKIRARYRSQQGAALEQGSRTLDAIAAYKDATALDPNVTWSWIHLGRLYEIAGNLAATEAAQIEAQNAAARANDVRSQAVAAHEIGDVRFAQGNLSGALAAFSEYQGVIQELLSTDPGNATWQRHISVSHEKIGDVRRDQGDLDGAEEAYRDSLAIGERLADSDPGNAGWQYDLGISNERIGNVLLAQGKLSQALTFYQERHSIIERLAAGDPGNAGWQRDLIVSRWKLADLAERYVSEEALDHWLAALAIAKELEASGRLRPTDSHFVETIQERIDALSAPSTNSDG